MQTPLMSMYTTLLTKPYTLKRPQALKLPAEIIKQETFSDPLFLLYAIRSKFLYTKPINTIYIFVQNAQYPFYQTNIQQKVVGFPLDDLHKRIANLHRIFILHNPLLKDCTIWVLLWFCMPSGSQHTCSAVDTERIASMAVKPYQPDS